MPSIPAFTLGGEILLFGKFPTSWVSFQGVK